MNANFNALTPAETERLALLMEEMAEAQQVVGKILRHGYESTHPDGGPTNRSLLETEIGHVEHAIFRMHEAEDLDPLAVLDSVDEKAKKIGRYLHHQAPLDSEGSSGTCHKCGAPTEGGRTVCGTWFCEDKAKGAALDKPDGEGEA